MTIDLKTAESLATRYTRGTIIAILLFSGAFSTAGWKLWTEYKQLDEKRENLQRQEQGFSTKQIDFEKYRSSAEASLNKEKLDIERREFIVSQLERENEVKLETIQQRAKQYSDAFDKLQAEQETLNAVAQEKENDEHMSKLISEFSSIGVDLNKQVSCSDSDAISKYNKAKVKFDEILGFADAHDLRGKYDYFLNRQPAISLSCRPSMVAN